MPIYNLASAVAVLFLICLRFAACNEVTLAAKLSCHCVFLAQSRDEPETTLRKMKMKVSTPACYVATWLAPKTLHDYQCHIAETKCERKCRQKANEVFYRQAALQMDKKILKKSYVCRKMPSQGNYTLNVQYNTCKKKLTFELDRILC